MEENEVKQENSVNTEELKNETVGAAKQVRDTIKNVNVKDEAKATKGFIVEMVKNPLEKIKEIANDSTNKYFRTAIVLVIIWAVVALLGSISFDYFSWSRFGKILLSYVKIFSSAAILQPKINYIYIFSICQSIGVSPIFISSSFAILK